MHEGTARKKRIISVGFLLYSGERALLAHVTGGHNNDKCQEDARKDPSLCRRRHWSIIKGGTEPDDATWIDTATRELREETGIDLHQEKFQTLLSSLKADDTPISTYLLDYGSSPKEVRLYLLDDKEGIIYAHSQGSPCKCQDREMDAFLWADTATASCLCLWNQKHLFFDKKEPLDAGKEREVKVYGEVEFRNKAFEYGS